MRTALIALMILTVAVPVALGDEKLNKAQAQAKHYWRIMRRADVNSDDFVAARESLVQLISQLPVDDYVEVATSMMDRGAADMFNLTVIQMFGREGLPKQDLAKLLNSTERTWPQRILLRTYWKLARPENETELTPQARLELVTLLADRLNALSQAETVSYGEQRLLSHMLQSVLTRYAGQGDQIPAVKALYAAMDAYQQTERPNDILARSIQDWKTMSFDPDIDSQAQAMQALGHFNPMVRTKAATYLGMTILKTPELGEKVLALLRAPGEGGDPRDEVRAAAAEVFSFALSYKPDVVIPQMVNLVVWDRGVTVQRAAGETLIAHSNQAAESFDMLLDALEKRVPRPGPKRAETILTTLGYLVTPQTPAEKKQRLLELSQIYLFPGEQHAAAPQGALRALEALGPFAAPAIPDIRKFRERSADRLTRQYIDRHVMESINPSAGG
jgi:hypothetical protein